MQHEFRHFILQQADIDELARRERDHRRGTRFVSYGAMRVTNEAEPKLKAIALEPKSEVDRA
jgi:hypothetical protein